MERVADGPALRGPCGKPDQLRPGAGCVMGLPSRAFFSLPLWVPVVEESPARDQTQMKLEMRGMLGANPEAAVWNFEPFRREPLPAGEEGAAPAFRQLEATAVLASPFQESWLVEEATRHEPAGRMLPAPAPAGVCGVLRRELGHWVADFFLGGKWLHTQPLLASSLDGAAAVELAATTAQLEGEGVLPPLEGWFLQDGGPGVSEDFRRGLGFPLKTGERPVPRAPAEVWNLPPPALTERRAERVRQARRKKTIRGVLTGYAAAAVVVLAFFAWPFVRLKMVERQLAAVGPEADRIRQTALVWREAGAWLEPRYNALELLWQVSRPLIEADPPKIEGVRLTLFDYNPKRLLLQGEGKDLEVVEKYFKWLKGEPGLAGFTWKNPQPRLLPNGNAQFQAEGILAGGAGGTEEGGEAENPNSP